ncbi:MAG: IS66 family transposase [Aquiluna sp.]
MKKNKQNKRKNIKLELSKSESDEVLSWSKAQTENPDLNKDVRKVLEDLVSILDGGENAEQKMDNLRKALAISMRILPSSERRVPEDSLKTGALKDVEDKLLRARRIARFAGLRVKELEELAEKLREIYQREREESDSSKSSQDGDDDAENDEPENEAVFGAAVVKRGVVVTDLTSLLVPGTEKGKFVTIIERKRTDLQLTSSEYVFRGKEYFDPETGERGSYDFSLIGPPEFSFTHRACIHVVMQVVGLGMPLSRLERMLGGTPFSRQSIHRIIGYVAYHLAPVYLQLCDELAEAPLLLMDDTHTRVVEVDKALLGGGPYPWDEPPKNKKKGIKDNEPEPVRSLVLLLKEHFKYAFPQVRDPQKIKTQHLT